ncbi:DUF4241 domain-containing protein [Bergeyella porcorum]|uniref:DUF4241 domain-containing protein n=1 Tax=Bergeyella porcorum TaxID=1735111 RepID=UPI0035E921A7
MKHIDNIAQLFSKNFVAHPLIDSFDVGKLYLPTGKLVACDPLITNDKDAFIETFPQGEFSVFVHKEKESNCVAYVEVVFGENEVKTWKMATCEGQNVEELEGEEIFGYPVQSGMASFMDSATQEELNHLEQKLFKMKGVDFMGIYEEFFHEHFFDENGAIDQYAFLKPSDENAGNIFAFEAGYGEGFYASYIGYDAEGKPIKIITEFIEILS